MHGVIYEISSSGIVFSAYNSIFAKIFSALSDNLFIAYVSLIPNV